MQSSVNYPGDCKGGASGFATKNTMKSSKQA
jgi:hypothetical protein